MRIAFFGSSLVSAYWNGAATYYRGIIRQLYARGHSVTFFEPDAYDRQKHRDLPNPVWADVVVYGAEQDEQVYAALEQAHDADLIVKTSGVGVFDELLEREVLTLKRPDNLVVFWDVDAPATLERITRDPGDPFRKLIPRYDCIFTYGGGDKVVRAYTRLGAQACHPIYNALDPETHFPAREDPRFSGLCGFVGHRLPDREARVDEFFFRAAAAIPERRFVLAGNAWESRTMPANVAHVGYVSPLEHNAFNSTVRAVLNINRDSMARVGYSPPTRVFEAAGAGACLITDAWPGIEEFLEPGREVLIASNGDDVTAYLSSLSHRRAREIGTAARLRVLKQHTYRQRVLQFEKIIDADLRTHAQSGSSPNRQVDANES